jgi:hypothetical protein
VSYFFYTRTLLFPTSGKKRLPRMKLPPTKTFGESDRCLCCIVFGFNDHIFATGQGKFLFHQGEEYARMLPSSHISCQNEKSCVHRIESYRNSNEVLERKPILVFYVRCTMTMKTVVSHRLMYHLHMRKQSLLTVDQWLISQ